MKAKKKQNKIKQIASMCCGIASIPICFMPYFGLPLGIIALILGKGNKDAYSIAGRVTGIIGIVLNSITLVMLILGLLLFW